MASYAKVSNSSKIQEFRFKIEKDEEFKAKVGSHLIHIIDKINNLDKAKIIAKCFDHYIASEINLDTFCELSHIVNESFISDLMSLSRSNYCLKYEVLNRLVGSGATEFGMCETNDKEKPFDIGIRISKQGGILHYIMNNQYSEYKLKISKDEELHKIRMKRYIDERNTK